MQLESWLRCLTDLRNRCAHYSRMYYWSFAALPKMPKDCCYKVDIVLKHIGFPNDWGSELMKNWYNGG